MTPLYGSQDTPAQDASQTKHETIQQAVLMHKTI